MKMLSIVIVVKDDVDVLNYKPLQEALDSVMDISEKMFITQKPYSEE